MTYEPLPEVMLERLSALGNETRLSVLRLLIRADRSGMTAGAIADAVSARPNALSAHLSALFHAGLVRRLREGRIIRYYADPDGIRDLVDFLFADCCDGRPDLCTPDRKREEALPE